MAGGSITDMRRRNRNTVMREIAYHSPVSRSQISQRTGLTGAAVSRITRELINLGIITEGQTMKVKGQVGRRNVCLELAEKGAFVLGITLTANTQSVSIGNMKGDIIDQHRIAGLSIDDPVTVVSRISQCAKDLIQSTKIEPAQLIGCGISVGGVADSRTGVLVRSDPLAWNNIPLASLFSEQLGLPTQLEGRAVALLLSEQKSGFAKGKKNICLISNGLWIGGAMMLDGKIVKGQSNMIGQIGHFSIEKNASPRGCICVCGREGCLDAVASGLSILHQLRHVKLDVNKQFHSRLQALVEHTGSSHPEIDAVFKQAGRNMGYAVDALLSILSAEQILLTGVTQRHPEYIKGIQETLAKIRPSETKWPIRVSRVTSEQSAVWLGLNAFVFSPSEYKTDKRSTL